MKNGVYTNKFEDGEKVILKETGEIITIQRWSFAPNMKRYTYTIVEHPTTFVFEDEIESLTNLSEAAQ